MKKIILLACMFGLSGCALSTDQVSLQYTPQPGVAKVPNADYITVKVQVNDARPDKSKVSSKKNGFGMEMAAITANEDVASTVQKAIEKELQNRGFQVSSGNAQIKIAADLTRFYNDFKVGVFSGDAVADLNMSVAVQSKAGAQLYSRQIVAQGTEANTMLASGENARLALEQALANGLKMLFSDPKFIAALTSAS